MQPQDYLYTIVSPVLKHPEVFTITPSTDEMGVLLTLSLHKDDMGVVIGKQGETAKAIRLLLRIIGMKGNARVSMRINEPMGSHRRVKEEVTN